MVEGFGYFKHNLDGHLTENGKPISIMLIYFDLAYTSNTYLSIPINNSG